MKKVVVKFDKVSKHYLNNDYYIFNEIKFEIKNEITAIIGPNGCGKTSLIRMLAGFEAPSKGKILINSIKGRQRTINDPSEMINFGMAYAGQDDNFLGNATVKQNIVLGNEPTSLKIFPNWTRAEKQILTLMQKLKIKLNLDKFVRDLAIEEIKKLALLRALYKKPRILLLDEPTVGLSDQQKQEFEIIFQNLADAGITVIFTTRDEKFGLLVAKTVVWINQQKLTTTNVSKQTVMLASNSNKYWKAVINHSRIAIPDSRIPLFYVHNLTVRHPKFPKFHNLKFAVRPGEIYGIYDYDNIYSEIFIDSTLGFIQKHVKKELWFEESDVSYYNAKMFAKIGFDWVSGQYYQKALLLNQNLLNNYAFWNYNKRKYVTNSGIIKMNEIQRQVTNLIRDYQIQTDGNGKVLAKHLSKGELQKFVIGRSITELPKILLLSNPFADLDLESTRTIVQKILNLTSLGHAILIIDCDPHVLVTLCNRVAILKNKTFVAKLCNEQITVKNLRDSERWKNFPLSNEVIRRTEKMYRLPPTRLTIFWKKCQIEGLKMIKPFSISYIWMQKQIEKLKRWLN